MITEEVKEQWKRPINDFKWNVKCCYNCWHWQKDPALRYEYAYNDCLMKKNTMTVWDKCCEHYSGTATEENLIANLTQEECNQLKAELDN